MMYLSQHKNGGVICRMGQTAKWVQGCRIRICLGTGSGERWPVPSHS